jgi:hypothetical protein
MTYDDEYQEQTEHQHDENEQEDDEPLSLASSSRFPHTVRAHAVIWMQAVPLAVVHDASPPQESFSLLASGRVDKGPTPPR